MRLVARRSQVQANIRLLVSYLDENQDANSEFAKGLIQRGICFLVVRHGGDNFFAPSRFVGYIGDSRRRHRKNRDVIDGRKTNRALAKRIGFPPRPSQRLEREYRSFCAGLNIEPRTAGRFGVPRKFWDLR